MFPDYTFLSRPNPIPFMQKIVTHPGSAHKDDFLACCLLIAEYNLPVERREPTEEDLKDASTFVVDVGLQHEPTTRNFDHHQFDRDRTPTCALSLILQDFGLYNDARKFCPWLETAEWLDVCGPRQTARWLNADPFVVAQLSSPIDFSILRYFAAESSHRQGEMMWELMHQIGSDLLNYLRDLRRNLHQLADVVERWEVKGLQVCYLPRVDGFEPVVSESLGMYAREADGEISALVSPDRRGTGFGLRRFDDDVRFDFTKIKGEPDVHFVHKQGFIAKTTATAPSRLYELLSKAVSL